jgi:ubiquinone/menaquinone biosynthesis C-methylase UbiE
MTFYDELSPYYDQMISFESRFENEKKIFENVLQEFPAKTILDAGCGSGYHSILLSGFGKKVSGFDPSRQMISLARQNAITYNCHIDFYETDFLNFDKFINLEFDAIYSLGNSFVHLLNKDEIFQALKKFNSVLNLNGYVCIGIVNYDKVLKTGQTEISKKEKNEIIFHRYYTLNEKTITFHVNISGKENHHFETELYPLTSIELIDLATKAGFKNIQLFGNLKLDEYKQYESENIVAFLEK